MGHDAYWKGMNLRVFREFVVSVFGVDEAFFEEAAEFFVDFFSGCAIFSAISFNVKALSEFFRVVTTISSSFPIAIP
jgi:hypothetical protein